MTLTLLTVTTALVCLLLMGVVLIQNPKGGGLDSTFGGGGANQMLGAAKTTDFIEKLTWGLAIILMVLCLTTSLFVGTTGNNSRIQDTSSIELDMVQPQDGPEAEEATYYL